MENVLLVLVILKNALEKAWNVTLSNSVACISMDIYLFLVGP